MAHNIKCANTTFKDIEMVMLDVSGTLINYEEIWLKQIGYIAQILAEKHSIVQGELFRTRAMIMKVLGVDPETGDIDYSTALFSAETGEIKAILNSILYLNNVKWNNAVESVQQTFIEMNEEIDFLHYTKRMPHSKELIYSLSENFKVISYSKRCYENSEAILNHHNMLDIVDKHYSLYSKESCCNRNTEDLFLSNICNDMNIKPANVLIIADTIYDLCFNEIMEAKRILVNEIFIDNASLQNKNVNCILTSLKEVTVN